MDTPERPPAPPGGVAPGGDARDPGHPDEAPADVPAGEAPHEEQVAGAPAPAAAPPEPGAAAEAAPDAAPPPGPAGEGAPPVPAKRGVLAEPPEEVVEVPRRALDARTRRDFLLFAAGTLATGLGAWWLLPDRTRARLLPQPGHDALDTIAARVGLTRERREAVLDRALTFDDDVAEALYSRDRRVRTYRRSQVTPLKNNYAGRTPGPEYLPGWRLRVAGLAGGASAEFTGGELLARFGFHEMVTRLVCVEGWSAVAWWGGIRFADFLAAFPPAGGSRWAALRSAVNLDGRGRPDPYYVSIDLETARHPQALLATHLGGRPLTVAHGAPLRLVAPMKLGLKNIKALTHLEYSAGEPPDYWAQRGYSSYDGL